MRRSACSCRAAICARTIWSGVPDLRTGSRLQRCFRRRRLQRRGPAPRRLHLQDHRRDLPPMPVSRGSIQDHVRKLPVLCIRQAPRAAAQRPGRRIVLTRRKGQPRTDHSIRSRIPPQPTGLPEIQGPREIRLPREIRGLREIKVSREIRRFREARSHPPIRPTTNSETNSRIEFRLHAAARGAPRER